MHGKMNVKLLYLFSVGVEGYCCTRSHSLTHTPDRTPMDEGSARRRGLYLHNNEHSQGTSMPTVELEPAIQESERPLTNASDRAASGIGFTHYVHND